MKKDFFKIYNNEFKKLLNLDSSTIKKLEKLKKYNHIENTHQFFLLALADSIAFD